MKLTLIFLLSLLLGLGLARRRSYLGLLALPLALLLMGFDQRLLGLGLGLAVLLVGNLLRERLRLSAAFRVFPALLAGLASYYFGFRISFITNPQGGFIYLSWLSLPLTLVWIAAVSYSLSLIGTWGERRAPLQVALIAALAFLAVGLLQGQSLELALAMVSGLIGLILASLFRGGGKVFAEGLGFTLALISIAGVLKTTASLALLGPLLGLGLPLGTASLSVVYGAVQRTAFLRYFRRYGLLIYLATSYLSVGLLLVARAPAPRTILILSGITLGTVLLWRWGRTAHHGLTVTGGHLWLFRVPLARVGLVEAVDRLERWLLSGKQAVVATPDTAAVMRAQRDSRLLEAYQRADLVTPDGIGLVWASRLLGTSLPQRVTGIDMVEQICRRASRQGYRIFLLGGRPGVAEEAKGKLEERFPGIRIVGVHHGFFGDNEEVNEQINVCRPDILLVGLGVPRQELWMMNNKDKLTVKMLIGVGGSFDVLSGRLPRAPLLWQRLGLEWSYRLLLQPWRAPRALAIPAFLLKILLLGLQGLAWTKSSSSS